MAKNFKLLIVTPEGTVCETDVDKLVVNTDEGPIGILADRLSIITTLVPSITTFTENGEEKEYFTAEGIFKFRKNKAVLMVASAETREEIDVRRAEDAKKRAEDRLKSRDEKNDAARAQLSLSKSVARLKLYKKNK